MALNKKSVDDINAKGKRVLVRCDFNVPLKNGEITDDTRIKAALPTIKKLLNDGGKVILCSHLGKVKNGPNEGESLAPVAKRLEELLGQKVNFVSDYNVTGEAATKAVDEMKEGEVVLLQNTRFRGAEETKNGEEFSKELADLADIYVCDAFGSSHRAHASVAGVTKFITAKGGQNVVGYLMEKEIAFLGNAVENPVRPFVAILGGAKVADKLNVINNLLEKCDTLIIGGGMAYTFIKAQGYEIGLSLCDDEKLDYCKEMMAKAEKMGKKILLPVDAVTIKDFPDPIDGPVETEVCDITAMPADRQGELSHRYVLGVYEMQERLTHDFPDLLLENCSGGGARFDPGMLYYSPQIWCSDDTDAIERLVIQEGTALIYPLSAMGAHVSDCPNHTVGRNTPFKTRGEVALAGTFGYELDITKIAKEEQEQIPQQTAMYHKYNDLVREGDYYRIASYRENHFYDCYMVVSKDKKEALVTFVTVHARPNYHSLKVRLQGLNPNLDYRLEGEMENECVYGGDLLMNAGMLVPSEQGDYRSYLYHFVAD